MELTANPEWGRHFGSGGFMHLTQCSILSNDSYVILFDASVDVDTGWIGDLLHLVLAIGIEFIEIEPARGYTVFCVYLCSCICFGV